MSSKILILFVVFSSVFTVNSLLPAKPDAGPAPAATIIEVPIEPSRSRRDIESEILSTTVLIEMHFQKYIGVSKLEEVTTPHATVWPAGSWSHTTISNTA